MKNSKVVKIVLIVAGLVGMIVGGANLFVPVEFNASSGIELGTNISLINEMRASGGALLLSGIVIFLGAFLGRLTFTSVLLTTILYLGYGFSRIVSMMVDGIPSNDLVVVAIFEITIGLISIFIFYKYRIDQKLTSH